MWIYEIETNPTGVELAMAESAQEAVKVLKAEGIKLHQDPDGEHTINTLHPDDVVGNEKIYLSDKAKESTTCYELISKATGLKYVKHRHNRGHYDTPDGPL